MASSFFKTFCIHIEILCMDIEHASHDEMHFNFLMFNSPTLDSTSRVPPLILPMIGDWRREEGRPQSTPICMPPHLVSCQPALNTCASSVLSPFFHNTPPLQLPTRSRACLSAPVACDRGFRCAASKQLRAKKKTLTRLCVSSGHVATST